MGSISCLDRVVHREVSFVLTSRLRTRAHRPCQIRFIADLAFPTKVGFIDTGSSPKDRRFPNVVCRFLYGSVSPFLFALYQGTGYR